MARTRRHVVARTRHAPSQWYPPRCGTYTTRSRRHARSGTRRHARGGTHARGTHDATRSGTHAAWRHARTRWHRDAMARARPYARGGYIVSGGEAGTLERTRGRKCSTHATRNLALRWRHRFIRDDVGRHTREFPSASDYCTTLSARFVESTHAFAVYLKERWSTTCQTNEQRTRQDRETSLHQTLVASCWSSSTRRLRLRAFGGARQDQEANVQSPRGFVFQPPLGFLFQPTLRSSCDIALQSSATRAHGKRREKMTRKYALSQSGKAKQGQTDLVTLNG